MFLQISRCIDGKKDMNQHLVDEFDRKHDGDDHQNIDHVERLRMKGAEHMNLHAHNINPSSSLFFNLNDLEVGKTIPLHFSKKLTSSSHFLPRDEADSIPFSLKQLPSLVKLFSFPQGSKQAKAMEDTLRACECPPIKGETKFCATSMESMLDFALRIFKLDNSGDENHPIPLTSSFHSATSYSETSITSFQNYTIMERPREVLTSKMIGCHTMPYPYIVFHCHTQEGGSKVYEILFRGENGDILDAVAACHLDTSDWDPNHVSFRVLGIEPGNPVCHIFPPHGNLLWVHHTPTTTSG